MIAIMNETLLWHCDVCDRTNNFSTRLRLITSKSQKHKKESGTVVKEYDFIKREIDEVNYIPNDTTKKCKKNYLPFIWL